MRGVLRPQSDVAAGTGPGRGERALRLAGGIALAARSSRGLLARASRVTGQRVPGVVVAAGVVVGAAGGMLLAKEDLILAEGLLVVVTVDQEPGLLASSDDDPLAVNGHCFHTGIQ